MLQRLVSSTPQPVAHVQCQPTAIAGQNLAQAQSPREWIGLAVRWVLGATWAGLSTAERDHFVRDHLHEVWNSVDRVTAP